MRKHLSLAALLSPVSTADFYLNCFETRHLLVRRNDEQYFGSVLRREDINGLLSTRTLTRQELFVVNAERHISASEFVDATGVVVPSEVDRLHCQGATVLFRHADRYHAPLGTLCERLGADMGAQCFANVYVTPPGAQGFRAHFDTHDVFIMQLQGVKLWRLYRTPIPFPTVEHADQAAVHEPGNCIDNLEMSPGDTLYIPRGLIHEARACEHGSAHVTVGVVVPTWGDLCRECLTIQIMRNPELRRALPRIRLADGSVMEPAVQETFAALLDGFRRDADFKAGVDAVSKKVKVGGSGGAV